MFSSHLVDRFIRGGFQHEKKSLCDHARELQKENFFVYDDNL